MAGFLINFGFVGLLLTLLNNQLALAWIAHDTQASGVDPDMIAFENSSGDFNNPSSLDDCQQNLSICRKQSKPGTSSSQDEVLDKMKEVVGSWMYRIGMHNFQLPAGDKKSIPITLSLSDVDLSTINMFLKYNSYPNFISVVPILNRVFTVNTHKPYSIFNTEKSETIMEAKEKWVRIIFNVIMSFWNKETMLVVTCMILFIYLIKAMIFGVNHWVLLLLFFFSVFFAGFLWNWAYMYQKAVVDQHVKRVKYEKYASSCQPDDSFWGFFKHLFGYRASIDECTEYFRGVQIDPLLMVPPTDALSETLAMFIIHPMVLMAENMSKIAKILFGDMVGGMYIGVPLVILTFGGMFITFALFITGRRIKMNFLSLGSIEVGSQFESLYNRLEDDPRRNRSELRRLVENQKVNSEINATEAQNMNATDNRSSNINSTRAGNTNSSNSHHGNTSSSQTENTTSSNNHPGNANKSNNHHGNASSSKPANTNVNNNQDRNGTVLEEASCHTIVPTCCHSLNRNPCVSQYTSYMPPCEQSHANCQSFGAHRPICFPSSFSKENSGNPLRHRLPLFTSGGEIQNRRQPFRNLTDNCTRDNIRGLCQEGRGVVEEFTYRRRKLSF